VHQLCNQVAKLQRLLADAVPTNVTHACHLFMYLLISSRVQFFRAVEGCCVSDF